jgi:uncharacterized membrane protein
MFKNMLEPAIAMWYMALIFVLNGYGIYLGRELRFNSWDVFVRPEALLSQAVENFSFFTLIFTVLLSTATFVIYDSYIVIKGSLKQARC